MDIAKENALVSQDSGHGIETQAKTELALPTPFFVKPRANCILSLHAFAKGNPKMSTSAVLSPKTNVSHSNTTGQDKQRLPIVEPWLVTADELADCSFYHTLDLPGIGMVPGCWDLRDTIDDYFGGHNFKGQTVLELGTASGFCAFHMAKQGAKVTGCDLPEGRMFNTVPYATMGAASLEELRVGYDVYIDRMKRGFWLSQRLLGLPVDMMYLQITDLKNIDVMFDTVVTAQTLVHMMNPIEAFFCLAAKAKETLIFVERPATHLGDTVPYAMFYPDAGTEQPNSSWWCFSVPMIRQLFAIAGFEIVLEADSRHLCNTMDPKVENPMALMRTFIGKRKSSPIL